MSLIGGEIRRNAIEVASRNHRGRIGQKQYESQSLLVTAQPLPPGFLWRLGLSRGQRPQHLVYKGSNWL